MAPLPPSDSAPSPHVPPPPTTPPPPPPSVESANPPPGAPPLPPLAAATAPPAAPLILADEAGEPPLLAPVADHTTELESEERPNRVGAGWLIWLLPLLLFVALVWALVRILGGDDDAEAPNPGLATLPTLVDGAPEPDPNVTLADLIVPSTADASPLPGSTVQGTPDPAASTPGTQPPSTQSPASLPGTQAPTSAAALPEGTDVTPVGARASCTAPSSTDSRGNPVNFRADNLLDGKRSSAWRCEGRGVGESITFSLASPVRIAQVGITPGWVHYDPHNNDDRYLQNRRLRTVRWECLDATGTATSGLDQAVEDNRSVQLVATPTFASCSAVRLLIRETTNYRSRNFVAVSDVVVKIA